MQSGPQQAPEQPKTGINHQATLNRGMALHREGHIKVAKALFKQIPAGNPQHAEALHRLGIIAKQEGHRTEAQTLMERALALQPRMPAVLNNLGILHMEQGSYDAAIDCYRKSLALQPDNPLANNNLGHVLRLQDKRDQALTHLQRAVTLKPTLAEALNNLGLLYKDMGHDDEAIVCFRQALTHKPNLAAVHNNLGNLLIVKGLLHKAHEHFKEALKLQPDYADASSNLGNCLRLMDRLQEACDCYERAMRLQPPRAPTLNNYGVTLKGLGRLEEAKRAFQQAVNQDPACAIAYRHMVSCSRMQATDRYTVAMQKLYGDPATPEPDRINLAYALHKLYEDLGDHRRAFDHLAAGNRLERTHYHYFITEDEARFARQRALAGFDGAGYDDPTPIFILGMPRSGTTLIEQILASHPQIHGAGERTYLPHGIIKLWSEISHHAAGRVGPPVSWRKDIEALKPERITTMGRDYMQALRRHHTEARFITDKMPGNFQHIGWILAALPKARIIHCTRHPMATCYSIFKTLFSEPHPYAYHLSELGRYYRAYQALMQHWHAMAPDRIYDLSYEKMVQDQEGETSGPLRLGLGCCLHNLSQTSARRHHGQCGPGAQAHLSQLPGGLGALSGAA